MAAGWSRSLTIATGEAAICLPQSVHYNYARNHLLNCLSGRASPKCVETFSMANLVTPMPHTLLSLASKQIWPHVLTAAWLKPERVFLLHSQDANESQGPAQRLKRFLDETGLVPRDGTRLEHL